MDPTLWREGGVAYESLLSAERERRGEVRARERTWGSPLRRHPSPRSDEEEEGTAWAAESIGGRWHVGRPAPWLRGCEAIMIERGGGGKAVGCPGEELPTWSAAGAPTVQREISWGCRTRSASRFPSSGAAGPRIRVAPVTPRSCAGRSCPARSSAQSQFFPHRRHWPGSTPKIIPTSPRPRLPLQHRQPNCSTISFLLSIFHSSTLSSSYQRP